MNISHRILHSKWLILQFLMPNECCTRLFSSKLLILPQYCDSSTLVIFQQQTDSTLLIYQAYKPSPPQVPSSTASPLNSTESSSSSTSEKNNRDNNSFNNPSRENSLQPRQPWQARKQHHSPFPQQQDKVRYSLKITV